MNAITIINPYGYLIALPDDDPQAKRVENRTWAPPLSAIGKPIAIHAGKARKYNGVPVKQLAQDYGITEPMEFGAIIAVADLVGYVFIRWGYQPGSIMSEMFIVRSGGAVPDWIKTHEHAEGPCCWILDNVRRLAKPIPWDGKQGIWQMPENIIEAEILDFVGRHGRKK